MENIGVTLKVTGASAAIQAIDKYNKSVDNLWSTLGKAGAANAVFNSALNTASTAVNNAKTALDQLNKTADKTGDGIKKTGDAAGESGSKFHSAKSGADDTRGAFGTLAGMAGGVAGKLADVASTAGGALVSGFKDAAGAVLGFAGDFASAVGSVVVKGAEMGIDFVKSSVKVAADFDSSMRVIQATSGASAEDMKKLTDYAIDLGVKFPVSTKDVADGFGELTKAGFTANQVLAAGNGLITLGVAANMSNAQSAEILAGTIRGFGLQAEDTNRVVDILATTANASSVDVTDLAQTFKYAAPAAKLMGFSLEDVSIASGILGNNMIKGSSAGTGLAAIFSRMASPTADSAAAMKALGFSLVDSNNKVRPLRDILGELRTKFAGLSQVEQFDLAKKMAGQDAAKTLLTLINATTEDFNTMTTSVDTAGGSAQKMADIMSGGTKGALDNLSGSVEALQIKLGTALAPALLFVVGKLSEFANTASLVFSEIMMGINGQDYKQGAEHMTTPFIEFGKTLRQTLIPALKQVADFFFNTVVPAAAGFAVVLLTDVIPAVIGFATQAGQFLAPILATVAGFVTGQLIPGFMKFASDAAPVVISAVQTIAAFFVDTLIPGVISFAKEAAPVVQAAIKGIGDFFTGVLIPAAIQVADNWNNNLYPAFVTVAGWIQTNLVPVIVSMADTFTGTVLPAVGRFGDFVRDDVLPKLVSFGDWFGTTIMPVIEQFIAFITDPLIPTIGKIAAVILDVVIPTITNWIGVIATFLTPVISALVGFISGTVIPVMGNIASFIGSTVIPAFVTIGTFINTNVMPVLSTLAGYLGGAFAAAFTNIGTVIGGVWEFIKNAISTAWGIIQGVFNIITSVLSGNFAGAWEGIKQVISAVWNGISNFIGESWHTVSGVFDNITGVLGGPFKAAWDAIKTVIETVWTGIVSAVQSGKSLLDPIFDGIKTAVEAVGKVWDALVETIKKGVGVVGAVARGDWSGAWDIMTGKATEGAATTVKEIDKIANSIASKDFSASARQAGATIGAGLKSGIESAAGGVVAAASNIAQQAINAAKSRLRSESPSKVFVEIGQNVGDGFVIGINDKNPEVATAIGQIIDNQVITLDGKRTPLKESIDRVMLPISLLPDAIDRKNPVIGRSMIDVWENLALVTDMKSGMVDDAIQRLLTPIKDAAGQIAGLIGTADDPATPVKQITDHIGIIIGTAARQFAGDIEAYVAALRKLRGEMTDVLNSMPGPQTSSGAVGTPLVGGGGATIMPLPTGGSQGTFSEPVARVASSFDRVSATPTISQLSVGATSQSSTVNNNHYLTVNSALESSGVIADYDLMKLMV
jgi:TP901 family phage tail tape measure protein